MLWATERDMMAAVHRQVDTYRVGAASSQMPQTGDDPELPPAPTDAPQPGNAEPQPAGGEIPELPERWQEGSVQPQPEVPRHQGVPNDDSGEMETPPAHVPPLPSGGELPEEQPDWPSRPSTGAGRQSVPDWPTEPPTDRRRSTAEQPRPVPVPPGPPDPEPNPDPDPLPKPPLVRPVIERRHAGAAPALRAAQPA